jgi:RNA polymerase sigma-70 factor (ECF subfamily)
MTEDRLTDLYRRYGGVIFMRCRSILSDEAEAEDATQETFVRVHRHLERVPGEREALYWIYRVATNYCLNELRDRKRRPAPGASALPERSATGVDLEARLADRDFVVRLVEAVHEKVRPVAWLYHVDGFEQEEIAQMLDLSRRTVSSRLAAFSESARKFLRRAAA